MQIKPTPRRIVADVFIGEKITQRDINQTVRNLLDLTVSAIDAWDFVKASALVEAAGHIAPLKYEAKLKELYESIGNNNRQGRAMIKKLLAKIK